MPVEEIESIEEWNLFIESLWKQCKESIFVIDAYAEWCGPCKAVKPKYIQLSELYPNIKFLSIDIEKVPRIAKEFEIASMPTFLIFKGFKMVKRIVGADIQAVKNSIENC